MLSTMYRIIQSPTVVALLYETGSGRYRQIYMDGRKLPHDPNPTWLGYSESTGAVAEFVLDGNGR
jgi:hypothetical protein